MLTWNWKNEIGYVELKNGKHAVIRTCNGLFVIHQQYYGENQKELANLYTFAIDKSHARNCAKDGVYEDIITWHIFNKNVEARRIAKLLIDLGLDVHFISVPFIEPYSIKWDW